MLLNNLKDFHFLSRFTFLSKFAKVNLLCLHAAEDSSWLAGRLLFFKYRGGAQHLTGRKKSEKSCNTLFCNILGHWTLVMWTPTNAPSVTRGFVQCQLKFLTVSYFWKVAKTCDNAVFPVLGKKLTAVTFVEPSSKKSENHRWLYLVDICELSLYK